MSLFGTVCHGLSQGNLLKRFEKSIVTKFSVCFVIVCHSDLVGVTGFEPTTPASRTQCSTGLSYTPTLFQEEFKEPQIE